MPGLAQIGSWFSAHRWAALGFAVSTAFWPSILSSAFAPRWAAIAIGIPLVSAIDPRNLPEALRWVLLWVFGLAAIATTWASPDPMGGYLDLLFMTLLCLAFIAAAELDTLDDVMTGLGAGLAVSAAVLLFQAWDDSSGRSFYHQRMTGLFYNTEILAEFAALVFVWAIVRRAYVIAAVSFLPIAVNNSRVAFLCAAVGVAFAFWPATRKGRIAVLAVLVAFPVMLFFVFGISKLISAEHRITLWTATVFAWTQFGHGLGWYRASYPAVEFAHSDVLQIIAEIGIGGFALLAIPFMAFRSTRGNHAERALFIAACIQAVISFPLHFPASGFVVALVAGYLVSRRPAVCMVVPFGRIYDVRSLQRQDAGAAGTYRGSRSGVAALPDRPLSPARAGLRPRQYRDDPFDPEPCRGF